MRIGPGERKMKKVVFLMVILSMPSLAFGAGPYDGFWFVGEEIVMAIEQQGGAFFGGLVHWNGATLDGWAFIMGSVQDSAFNGTLLDTNLLPYGYGSFTFSGASGAYRRTDLQGNLVYEQPLRKLTFGSP